MLIDTWSRVDQPPRHTLRSAEDGSLANVTAAFDTEAALAAAAPL